MYIYIYSMPAQEAFWDYASAHEKYDDDIHAVCVQFNKDIVVTVTKFQAMLDERKKHHYKSK